MALLSDLVNLDLSSITDKIIAEYIWLVAFSYAYQIPCFSPWISPSLLGFFIRFCFLLWISELSLDSLRVLVGVKSLFSFTIFARFWIFIHSFVFDHGVNVRYIEIFWTNGNKLISTCWIYEIWVIGWSRICTNTATIENDWSDLLFLSCTSSRIPQLKSSDFFVIYRMC